MNPPTAEKAKEIFNGIKRSAIKLKKTETVICPPFLYLNTLGHPMSKSKHGLKLGAQDVFYDDEVKARTGEISVEMLKNFGVKYVIIGHSERRALGETDEIINKKILTALEAGLKAVFCVGEKERDVDGKYFDFIRRQITEGLKNINQDLLKNLIIAYEPSWAISGGKNLNPDDAESVLRAVLFVKKTLLPIAGDDLARGMTVIYGGSVSAETAGEFLAKGGVSGLLVGQKSLDPEEFGKILKIAEVS